jgi:hypothetical protein
MLAPSLAELGARTARASDGQFCRMPDRLWLRAVSCAVNGRAIELGMPSAAIDVLRPLAGSNDSERLEAKGLIGRANKDIYVNGRLGNTEIGKRTLQRALTAYGEAYKSNKPIWHGINIAARFIGQRSTDWMCPPNAPLRKWLRRFRQHR